MVKGTVWRLLLLITLLWAIAAPLAPNTYNQRISTAEAAGVSQAYLITACGSSVVCIAIVSAAVGATCYYSYVQGAGVCGVSGAFEVMEDMVDDLVTWFNSGGATVDLMTAQYSEHPDYIVPNQATFDAWFDAFGLAAASGWSFDDNYASTGIDAFTKNYSTTEGLNVIRFPSFIMPSAGAAGALTLRFYSQRYRAAGTTTHINEIKLRLMDDSTGACFQTSGACTQEAQAMNNGTAGWYESTTSIGLAAWQQAAGKLVHFEVSYPTADTGNDTKTMVIRAIDAFGITLDATTDIIYRWSMPDAQIATGVLVTPSATGERVFVPNDVGDLEDYRAGAIPLANGNTGVVVQPGVGTATGTGTLTDEDERPWWEGLFGGVRGRLGDIAESVANTYTAILALPTEIANLFNPAVGWADFTATQYPAVSGQFSSVVPGCYVAAVSSPGDLFYGTGGDMTIEMGGVNGSAPVVVTIPYRADIAAITKPLFEVLCACYLFMWMLAKVTKPIPYQGTLWEGWNG